LAAGAAQLEIAGVPMGLRAGLDLVIADNLQAEGARITQVQPLSDRTRVSLSRPLDFAYALGNAVVYGNVAEVTHGASAANETLGGGDPNAAPQRFELRRSPLAWVVDPFAPRGAVPAVDIFVGGERWTVVETLADSGPTDRHAVIEIDDRERAAVVFGDGVNGAAPPSGRNNIVARYRTGHGANGNVAALAINKMPQAASFLERTFNPAAASGGADRESPDQARQQARLRVRTLERAVSLADYADLALTFICGGKAHAVMQREGDGAGARRVIVVTCAAAGGNALSTPQKEALLAYLSARSPERARIRVRDHRVWPIRLALTVNVLPSFQQAYVQRALLAAFGNDAGGFFNFAQRELGADLALSDVYALAERTPGVDHVLATLLHAETEAAGVADRILVPADALATGGDATDASIGRLSLQLIGGLS
jgi:predicted phage baseplate assembly protein